MSEAPYSPPPTSTRPIWVAVAAAIVILLVGLLAVVTRSRGPALSPTATPPATQVPVAVLPYPQPTAGLPYPQPPAAPLEVSATPVAPPATPATPEATPTVNPLLTATGITPAGDFAAVWQQLGGANAPIGFPTGQENVVDGAMQVFTSGGRMIWIDTSPPLIYVLYEDGTLQRYEDPTYAPPGTPTPAPAPCNPPQQAEGSRPVRGFGQVWCRNQLWKTLGWGTETEKATHVRYQDFQASRMLCSTPRDNVAPTPALGCTNAIPPFVYMLREDNSTWKTFQMP